MKRPSLYFAYGSNLDVAQMERRCPQARMLGRATLPGYSLVFPLADEAWGGGVASIVPRPGGRVEGVLYGMDERSLSRLDDYEDTDRGDYVRRRVTVLADGTEKDAWTYVSPTTTTPTVPPSPAYLVTLIRGAEARGLPDDYVARLRALARREPEP